MLFVFKCIPEATIPTYATASSACFDVYACLPKDITVKCFVPFPCNPFASSEFNRTITIDDKQQFELPSGARALIPTGLKFNIPSKHSVRLHPRSGLSFKSGVVLANCQGVIDEDYVEQVFVPLFNCSPCSVTITHGDRICQGELVKDLAAAVVETHDEPTKKTDRSGGFGSTGV